MHVIRDGMYKLIGDGKDTTIWDDPWIFSIPLSWKPTYINMNVPFGKKKVARLIRAGNWNYDRLVEWFGPILAHNICKIILSPDNGSDEWIWAPKKDGKPSVKSIYHHINQGFYVPQATKWKVLWSLPVAPRVKNFLWKLLWNRLPTNERCYSLNSAPSPFCIYCSTPEDQNHIFLDCINARRIWDAVMSSTGILFSFNGDWITEEWIDEGKNLAVVQQQFIRALIANTFWQIWRERNARQFSNNSSSIQVILRHIMHMTLDYISKIPSYTIEHSNANKWCPPPDGWIKINTDASFKSEEGTAAIGYIARTNLGHVVFAAGRQIEANSVLEAEAKAMKEAIAEAHQHGLQRVCLESDSSLLIQCLQHAQLPPWPLRALVLGISSTMKKFAATQVLFVKREANMVADWLATRANLPQSFLFTNANRHPQLSVGCCFLVAFVVSFRPHKNKDGLTSYDSNCHLCSPRACTSPPTPPIPSPPSPAPSPSPAAPPPISPPAAAAAEEEEAEAGLRRGAPCQDPEAPRTHETQV
uniref:RNase H type-1 domain-containing protein n=1 Tax=Ananas comosus var. bracteatus TaxID=296719 RepID=A0A6V7PGI8_ANACO|nr:unnamed protein product [Ananas comosus var. bracteatus]